MTDVAKHSAVSSRLFSCLLYTSQRTFVCKQFFKLTIVQHTVIRNTNFPFQLFRDAFNQFTALRGRGLLELAIHRSAVYKVLTSKIQIFYFYFFSPEVDDLLKHQYVDVLLSVRDGRRVDAYFVALLEYRRIGPCHCVYDVRTVCYHLKQQSRKGKSSIRTTSCLLYTSRCV